MAVQQNNLFNIFEYYGGKKPPTKRIRYKKPTYLKSYQFRVFNEDTGQYQYYGDEKHILRIKTLHKIYSILYGYFITDVLEQFEKKEVENGLIILWGEEKQAEITGTSNLTIKERVKTHIKLLRMFRDKNKIYSSLKSINLHRGFVIEKV